MQRKTNTPQWPTFPSLLDLPLRIDSARLAGCLHTEQSSFLQTPPVLGSSPPVAHKSDSQMLPKFYLLKPTIIFKSIYLFLAASCLSCSKQDLCSREFRLSCPTACGILVTRLGIEPMSPILQVGFSTVGPPGKTLNPTFCFPVSSFSVCRMQTGWWKPGWSWKGL